MSQVFTAVGAVMLTFCTIWGYSWLEVWRDPKEELKGFYARHRIATALISLMNKAWLPSLIAGIGLLMAGFFMGEKT